MKIGIITFWQTKDNYGQVLQAYALQSYLIKIGHEPFIIRYDFINRKKINLIKSIKDIIKFCVFHKRYISNIKADNYIDEKNLLRNFGEFREHYFKFSNRIYKTLKELRNNPPIADVYVVGSDQVWSQLLSNKENKIFFLDFGNNVTRKISYAPSFARTNYPKELLPILSKELSLFDTISVREYCGVEICKSVGFKSTLVCDPTLLLTNNDYISLFDRIKVNFNNDYCFLYLVNITNKSTIGWDMIKNALKEIGLESLTVVSSGYYKCSEILDDTKYDYPSIERWLSYIYNSKLVITSSFHGIVFCIIMRKNFLYVPLKDEKSEGNNRVLDLLSICGLEKNILISGENIIDAINNNNFYNEDNMSNLMKFINSSKDFLNTAIH